MTEYEVSGSNGHLIPNNTGTLVKVSQHGLKFLNNSGGVLCNHKFFIGRDDNHMNL